MRKNIFFLLVFEYSLVVFSQNPSNTSKKKLSIGTRGSFKIFHKL